MASRRTAEFFNSAGGVQHSAEVELRLPKCARSVFSARYPDITITLLRSKLARRPHAADSAPSARIQSFQFSPPAESPISFPAKQESAAGSSASQPVSRNALLEAARLLRTRIQPPDDVIKLEDRLYFVLQPSLETLIVRQVAGVSVRSRFRISCKAWRFCIRGISAMLADEMGLGKTMQAITAMRMLLHAGEIHSVLLVCPKPLVTNWQREFALWAPEIAADGDRRRSGSAAAGSGNCPTCR